MGVNAISVGSNGANGSPETPAKVFKWLDKQSGKSVLATWHPRGYGGYTVEDCALVPNFNEALCVVVEIDNRGPATPKEVIERWYIMQSEFPNAKILASTFDSFFDSLIAADKSGKVNMPIATSEISDVWMYGVPSDPVKMAKYRLMTRLRSECIAQGQCREDDVRLRRFGTYLLKIPEHTWGISVNAYLGDFVSYRNSEFHSLQYTDNRYKLCASSWVEQRAVLDMAVESLEDHPLASKIKESLKELEPVMPSTSGYSVVSARDQYHTRRYTIKFDENTGAIVRLHDNRTRRQWADDKNKLVEMLYQTFDDSDYAKFLRNFMYNPNERNADFDKHGLGNKGEHNEYRPKLKNLYRKIGDTSTSFLLQLVFDTRAQVMFGAFEYLWVKIDVPEDQNVIDIRFDMFNKTSTRLPESFFVTFNPIIRDSHGYVIDKLDTLVSPLDIMKNGSVHQHGVSKGVLYMENRNLVFSVESPDVPVVAVGDATPFPSPMNELPDMRKGFHYNYYNNIWGTNYIMWYPYIPQDKDATMRYRIVLGDV